MKKPRITPEMAAKIRQAAGMSAQPAMKPKRAKVAQPKKAAKADPYSGEMC